MDLAKIQAGPTCERAGLEAKVMGAYDHLKKEWRSTPKLRHQPG